MPFVILVLWSRVGTQPGNKRTHTRVCHVDYTDRTSASALRGISCAIEWISALAQAAATEEICTAIGAWTMDSMESWMGITHREGNGWDPQLAL